MFYSYNEFLAAQEKASAYAKKTFNTIIENINSPTFPCYFAKNVFPKNSLYVSFIEDFKNQEDMFQQSMEVFSKFALIEKYPDPYRVFILSMNVPTKTWEEDNKLMWDFMRFLNQHDPEPWFSEIPTSTDDAGWSFSFMGMPWFFNLNSHNNLNRKSRNVSGSYSIILQRTDGFEKLLKAELDEKIREQQRTEIRKDVRARVGIYDGQSVSPALAGEPDNMQHLEWVQFHIPNLNTEKPQSKCPFHS